MLENNRYNIDKEFDYDTIKTVVLNSLQKMAKEETLKKETNAPYNYGRIDDNRNNVIQATLPTPLLKLKVRNATKYLSWRIAVLKRDNFTCKICHARVKENRRLRLEVHHAKAFEDICNENNLSTVEQALECKELWVVNNGISLCYSCHRYLEGQRTKL